MKNGVLEFKKFWRQNNAQKTYSERWVLLKKLEHYFASYTEYHQTKGNKITHYIGIPLIVFSAFGLLSMIHLPFQVDLGLALWFAGTSFYFALDRRRALPFSLITFAFYWLSRWVSMEAHWILFVVGWVFQGIGHYAYEKRSPAFFTNLSHLLIGPFWIFCRFWK